MQSVRRFLFDTQSYGRFLFNTHLINRFLFDSQLIGRFLFDTMIVLALSAAAAAIILFSIYFYSCQTDPNCILPTAYPILFGIVLATCGWVVTVATNRTLSRTQHTVNTLLQAVFSAEHRKHVEFFESHIRPEAVIPLETVKALDSPPLADTDAPRIGPAKYEALKSKYEFMKSVKYMANYYEFLAAAVIRKDFDERFLKECYCTLFLRFYSQAQLYIHYRRNELDQNGKIVSKLGTSRAFRNMVILHRRWSKR